MLPGMQPAADHAERLARLRLIRSENVGPVNFARLVQRFGTAAEALDALPEIASRAGRKRLRICPASDAEREWQSLEKLGARFLMSGDPDYPEPLAEIDSAPPVLAALGNLSLLDRPVFAIVGARNASANGRTLCRRITAELGQSGLVIASGLARGIDAEAHEAALPTGTVAAIAGGIDVVYPPENERLHHRIAEEGLILAEAPFNTQPRARHFPRRNRIIAGLSLGVLVVEAAMRSGSLITARQAGEQGREVFAVPGSPLDPRARGGNRLIRDGARLVESAADILDELGPGQRFSLRAPRAAVDPVAATIEIDPVSGDADRGRAAILEALGPEPAEADLVIRQTGLSSAAFNALALELEIAGRIERHAGNRYALAAG
ncbi:MAG: DNA-processing protein DprA [Minwuia sp.]|uniref:DNA-processing protein DprA n=1 Tax=Minwuia sp. TaxID=2493630 RepID=UPI003A8C737C